LDLARCKADFVEAMFEDLRWFGLEWQEGPDFGGALGPYAQSQRRKFYVEAFEQLRAAGRVYPCICSRQDGRRGLQAPHAGEDEPIYPGTCRPAESDECRVSSVGSLVTRHSSLPPNWRFRVPDGEVVSFVDGHCGPQQFVAGKDFGDFVVWRHD